MNSIDIELLIRKTNEILIGYDYGDLDLIWEVKELDDIYELKHKQKYEHYTFKKEYLKVSYLLEYMGIVSNDIKYYTHNEMSKKQFMTEEEVIDFCNEILADYG